MKHKPSSHLLEGKTGTTVTLDGKEYLYFAGTSYFQLHSHAEVIQAAVNATLEFGLGSATSRSMTGTTPLQVALEKKATSFFKTEDAVYLPSGYLCSLAGLKALSELDLYDHIFLDENSHYSLHEGAMTTGKAISTFSHRSVENLSLKIDKHLAPGERPLIASDGMFPIKAQLAPVDQYAILAEKHKGVVWIDDAHGVGILGEQGRGTLEKLRINSTRVYMGATLSKAFGSYGGIIPGPEAFVEIIRSGSVLTGSNSPLNAAVAAALKGIEILEEQPELRQKLWENAHYLKKGLSLLGISTDNNEIPVVSFSLGNEGLMKAIHESLLQEGIYIQHTHYRGSGSEGVLRMVVTSAHTKGEIDRLLESLREAIRNSNS
jgi:8-amino-7-oxononanoate synthase